MGSSLDVFFTVTGSMVILVDCMYSIRSYYMYLLKRLALFCVACYSNLVSYSIYTPPPRRGCITCKRFLELLFFKEWLNSRNVLTFK